MTEQINKRTAPPEAELDAYLDQKAPGLTQAQREEFKRQARNNSLDPWKREIYAVTYGGKGGPVQLSVVIGYEVFLKRANEFPQYDNYEIEWRGAFTRKTEKKVMKSRYGDGTYTKELVALVPKDEDVECIIHVYRNDRRHAVTTSVCWSEFAQDNAMWQGKPRIMLEKVAIARGHRLAFPNEFGGMPYIPEELPDYMGRNEDKEEAAAVNPAKPTIHPQQRAAAAEPAPKPDTDALAAFTDTMDKLCDTDPEAFNKAFAETGFTDYGSVPPGSRRNVYRMVQAGMERIQQERAEQQSATEEVKSEAE